jgi:hypothetical protein
MRFRGSGVPGSRVPGSEGDERLVEPLNDLVGQRITFLLDLPDLERGVPRRRVGCEHPFQERRPGDDAIGEGDEIVEELLFPGDKAQLEHVTMM